MVSGAVVWYEDLVWA